MIGSLQHLLVPGVVGRERELAELASFVDDIPRALRVVVLQGGPGVGKTTLARAAAALARERQLALLSCAGSELETELSYAALGDLLDPLLPAGFDALPAPQRHALEVALSLSEPGGAPPDQRAIAIATLSALAAAAARQPLLVAIDDVHWVDGSSLRVLAFAVRRLGDSAVGVVVTRRGDGAAPRRRSSKTRHHSSHAPGAS
jgi:predicted ATPase